jgi:uncharacterized RDD family membrane protein YckC/Tfp pilus assembly major pilin PilA
MKEVRLYCTHCGAKVDTTQQYCGNCGKPVGSSPAVSESAPAQPYAGFWKRLAAWILDYIVILLVIILLAIPLSLMGKSPRLGVIMVVAYLLTPWLYHALMESSPRQATLGKAALGIRVTDLAGERVSFGRATGRFFGKILSALTLSIGFAMAGFTERRQALHDKVADTLVVRKAFTPAEIADAPPAPTPSVLAVVGIGFLVVLFGPFGIGILAAIAMPAYQDYTIRSQVTQGLINAAPGKAVIADALANQSDLSQIEDDEAFTVDSPYVARLDTQDGIVVITFGGQAHKNISGQTVELVPGVVGSDEIVWRCGYAPGLATAQFVSDPPGKYTTLPPKYLPTSCR